MTSNPQVTGSNPVGRTSIDKGRRNPLRRPFSVSVLYRFMLKELREQPNISFSTCFKDRPWKGRSYGCLETNTIKLPEQLLAPEVRIIRDKNLSQITNGGRQNEFHRVKPFIVFLSKREAFFLPENWQDANSLTSLQKNEERQGTCPLFYLRCSRHGNMLLFFFAQ